MTIVYTVKQLAKLAGVSGRTLHYYDEIGLLKPSSVGENGYRYYDEAAILRLQQILFFRELDFSLTDIQTILNQPEQNHNPSYIRITPTIRNRVEGSQGRYNH